MLGLRERRAGSVAHSGVFTWWDYRPGVFHKDLGMRIDLVLASALVAGRVQAARVDLQAREGTLPAITPW